jgi:hypothetical protein
MGPPTYVRSVVQNIVMRRMIVVICQLHIRQVSPCRISGGQSGSGASIL